MVRTSRKKADTYRFNGLWGMIPVGIVKLESLIRKFSEKLADPEDADDKKWSARWLERFQRELTKKQENLQCKQAAEEKERRRSSLLHPKEQASP
jgi:hypothetical protein